MSGRSWCVVSGSVAKTSRPLESAVMQSLYRPRQDLRIPGVLGSQISTHSAHEKCSGFAPTHRPLLTSRKHFWYSFLLEFELTQGYSVAGRIMSMKNFKDTIGIRTFRHVAKCLNQMRHRVPPPPIRHPTHLY
jgi:hypothetical protein